MTIGESRCVRVASLPLLAALKIIAFAERGASDNRDLLDLRHIVVNYGDAGHGDRVFDELRDELATTEFERATAMLLGRDIAHAVASATLACVREGVACILASGLELHALALLGTCIDEDDHRSRLDDPHARFEALQRGLVM